MKKTLTICTILLSACTNQNPQTTPSTPPTEPTGKTKNPEIMNKNQSTYNKQHLEEKRNTRNLLLEQPQIKQRLPTGIQIFFDQTFKTVDYQPLKLDLYLPTKQKNLVDSPTNNPPPLIVWIHGGAWKHGDKTAFIKKNNNLVNTLLSKGYAIASLNYRLSNEAQFPAQIQDVNDGIEYLWQNADKYGFDKNNIAMMGRSAGGHLAGLVAMSNHHNVKSFMTFADKSSFEVQALIGFFGVYDFLALNEQKHSSANSPEGQLLGDATSKLVDIAKTASPITYTNNKAPATLLLHGLQDKNVPHEQSIGLHEALNHAKVNNELILVEGAGHGDPFFDSDKYVKQVSKFLDTYFPIQ